MSGHGIEYCGLDSVDELMCFIRAHWSADHILGHSRDLMDWQHRDEAKGRYNFLLARGADRTIVGILGFIPMSRFDPGLSTAGETVWFAMWKVLDAAPTGTGLLLIRELQRDYSPTWIGTVGLNAHVRTIYNALGYTTAPLCRWYRLNGTIESAKIMDRPNGWPVPMTPDGSTRIAPISREAFWTDTEALGLDDCQQAPRKTRASLCARYLEHPFYDYRVYAVHGAQRALIVTRICEHDGARALRIVDLLGPVAALAGAAAAFDALLAETGAEYVDFYLSGGEAAMPAAGFAQSLPDDALILPSFFEPFHRGNVEVVYAIKGPRAALTICKGDADQDRPNRFGGGV